MVRPLQQGRLTRSPRGTGQARWRLAKARSGARQALCPDSIIHQGVRVDKSAFLFSRLARKKAWQVLHACQAFARHAARLQSHLTIIWVCGLVSLAAALNVKLDKNRSATSNWYNPH